MGIIKKGEIIIKKLRKEIKELKKGFFEGKFKAILMLSTYFEICMHFMISIIILGIGAVIQTFVFEYKIIGYVFAAIAVAYSVIALLVPKVFEETGNISDEIFFYLFGKYGNVVTKKDWKNVKKHDRKLYKELNSKKSSGQCYFYSRALALHLKNAKVMFCSIPVTNKDYKTGHAVIVKNNCAYDTNARRHYDYEEYIKSVEIYRIFSVEDYKKESFFVDVYKDFKKWCIERDVYID